jgi:hypothetical protein
MCFAKETGMPSGRVGKSLNVNKIQSKAEHRESPYRLNRQARSIIIIKPVSVSALAEKQNGIPSPQAEELFLRFVRALAQHQARKDHQAEIETRCLTEQPRCETTSDPLPPAGK